MVLRWVGVEASQHVGPRRKSPRKLRMTPSWLSIAYAAGHSTASSRIIFYVVGALLIANVAVQVWRRRSTACLSDADGEPPMTNRAERSPRAQR